MLLSFNQANIFLACSPSQSSQKSGKPAPRFPVVCEQGSVQPATICQCLTSEKPLKENSWGRELETPYAKDVREIFFRLV